MGDKNNKFFHTCVTKGHRRNHFSSIINNNNQSVTDPIGIANVFHDYFYKLFRSSNPSQHHNHCVHRVEQCVSLAMNEELLQLYTSKEIQIALYQMTPFKSSGPDGFSAYF